MFTETTMRHLVRTSLLVALVLTSVQALPEMSLHSNRIVGGVDAEIVKYPYQLSLEVNGAHICGASIISVNWALTAAHCSGERAARMTLRAGTSTRGRGGTIHKVSQKIVYPRYVRSATDYDITLLKVSNPFKFGSNVASISLPVVNTTVEIGANATITGWGTLTEGGEVAAYRLQAVSVPIISQADCKAVYGVHAITPRMFCAGLHQGGKDACQGDSGGPMALNGKLIGVVSWGFGCARANYPGVYTNVANLRMWIKTKSGV